MLSSRINDFPTTAGMILIAEYLLCDIKEPEPPMPAGNPGMGGMGGMY